MIWLTCSESFRSISAMYALIVRTASSGTTTAVSCTSFCARAWTASLTTLIELSLLAPVARVIRSRNAPASCGCSAAAGWGWAGCGSVGMAVSPLLSLWARFARELLNEGRLFQKVVHELLGLVATVHFGEKFAQL